MTAQPIDHVARGMWCPDPDPAATWRTTPSRTCWTCPTTPPASSYATESSIVVPSPTIRPSGHRRICCGCGCGRTRQRSTGLTPAPAVGVAIGYAGHPRGPDARVLQAAGGEADHRYFLTLSRSCIAVEVVSPGTRSVGTGCEKPSDYGDGGDPALLANRAGSGARVRVRPGRPAGTSWPRTTAEELIVAKPFDIRLRVRDITP